MFVGLRCIGRRENCERLLESFRETASPGTDLLFILDCDDDSYDGMDFGTAATCVLDGSPMLRGGGLVLTSAP